MEKIEIEFYGNADNLLLILTGIGGTVKGYDDKYVKLSKKVIETQDFSVAVATTPSGSWEHTKENLDFIMQYVKNKVKGKIYAMGSSAGANILLMHAHEHPQIEQVLAVNPVLNINLFKIENGINKFSGNTTIVCGEKDMSSKFYKILKSKATTHVLQDIDHNFTNHLDQFIDLPLKYIFKD